MLENVLALFLGFEPVTKESLLGQTSWGLFPRAVVPMLCVLSLAKPSPWLQLVLEHHFQSCWSSFPAFSSASSAEAKPSRPVSQELHLVTPSMRAAQSCFLPPCVLIVLLSRIFNEHLGLYKSQVSASAPESSSLSEIPEVFV